MKQPAFRIRVVSRIAAIGCVCSTVALAACGDQSDSEAGWSVTSDTLANGALRVVNTPPATGIEPDWTLEEELRIGSADEAGPASFAEIVGLAVTSDGRIVVLDRQAQELRVFGPGGEHVATFGGKGAGPGELEGAWGIMRDAQDLLWVPDHSNARMSVYHPTDGFLRSYPLPHSSYGYVWDGAMLDDGRIVRPTISVGPEGRSAMYQIFDAGMAPVDSIPLPPAPETDRENPPGAFYWEAPGGMPQGYISVPFYPRGTAVFDSRGGVWSSAPGDAAYRISYASMDGDTSLVLETRRPPVPVTGADRDSAIAPIRERQRERGIAEPDWSKIPGTKPAVEGMFLADDGRLWVRTPREAGGAAYDIYERDGQHAGTVVTMLDPLKWISPVVRGDRLWAVVTDELDVPYVVRARLAEPERQP